MRDFAGAERGGSGRNSRRRQTHRTHHGSKLLVREGRCRAGSSWRDSSPVPHEREFRKIRSGWLGRGSHGSVIREPRNAVRLSLFARRKPTGQNQAGWGSRQIWDSLMNQPEGCVCPATKSPISVPLRGTDMGHGRRGPLAGNSASVGSPKGDTIVARHVSAGVARSENRSPAGTALSQTRGRDQTVRRSVRESG